jgi:hypothetical protein
MKLKIKTLDPAFFTVEQRILFHQRQADYFLQKFNLLPAFAVRRREVCQVLCEMHMAVIPRLQTIGLCRGVIQSAIAYENVKEGAVMASK